MIRPAELNSDTFAIVAFAAACLVVTMDFVNLTLNPETIAAAFALLTLSGGLWLYGRLPLSDPKPAMRKRGARR